MYESHKAEFDIARALIKARLAVKRTQAEVAKKISATMVRKPSFG